MTPAAITQTTHILPFDRLSSHDFERLCLWLVEHEGYERPKHLGAAGRDQGRDIVAWRGNEQWAFQCKRVKEFYPSRARKEVQKVLSLPPTERPDGLIFLVTCAVSSATRNEIRECCAGRVASDLWAVTKLDMKVRQHSDIVTAFFGIVTTLNVLRQAHPESESAFAKLEQVLHELIECHDALQEWKEIHHQLQTCFVQFRPFVTEVELAYNDVESWNPRRGERLWSPCRTQLEVLKSLAQRVKHIQKTDFREDTLSIRGDPWIVDIVRAGYDVEALLDGGNLHELYNCTLRLFEACDRHLRSVDREIRQVAASMSKNLHGTLGGIGR
jgi:hypothetical protein